METKLNTATDDLVNGKEIIIEEKGQPLPWRWVVLASSFFSLLLTGFGQYHAGVLKVNLIRHLDCDVKTTTWLMSYYSGCFALTAPLGSLLINLLNCRACVVLSGVLCLMGFVLSSWVNDVTYFFLTFTLIGVGQALSNTGSLVILGHYFPDRASVVSGASLAGGALGIFLHPPLLQGLTDEYGLRGALLISGAVAFQGTICGVLMRPARSERRGVEWKCHSSRGTHEASRSGCCSGHVSLVSWPLMCFLLSVFLMSLAVHSLMIQLPDKLIRHSGLTSAEASFAISIYGVGSFFSRLVSGCLAQDPRIGTLIVFCGLSGVQSLVSLAAPLLLSRGIVGSYGYCLAVGVYSGGCFALLFPIVYQIVGLHHSSTAFGLVLFVLGVGGLLGAPITELIDDNTGSKSFRMFGFVGALFLGSSVTGATVSLFKFPPGHCEDLFTSAPTPSQDLVFNSNQDTDIALVCTKRNTAASDDRESCAREKLLQLECDQQYDMERRFTRPS